MCYTRSDLINKPDSYHSQLKYVSARAHDSNFIMCVCSAISNNINHSIKFQHALCFYVCMLQVATCVALATTIYIQCIYGIFGREITKYTVTYGVYIQFWPTLNMCVCHKSQHVCMLCPKDPVYSIMLAITQVRLFHHPAPTGICQVHGVWSQVFSPVISSAIIGIWIKIRCVEYIGLEFAALSTLVWNICHTGKPRLSPRSLPTSAWRLFI